jgi:hypothetical protein
MDDQNWFQHHPKEQILGGREREGHRFELDVSYDFPDGSEKVTYVFFKEMGLVKFHDVFIDEVKGHKLRNYLSALIQDKNNKEELERLINTYAKYDLSQELHNKSPQLKDEPSASRQNQDDKVGAVLVAARRQQTNENLEVSRRMLENNADNFVNSSDEYYRYLAGWLELDKEVFYQLPVSNEEKKSWDKTQGEAYLKKEFDDNWNNTWWRFLYFKGLGYKVAKSLWMAGYVSEWLESSQSVVDMLESNLYLIKSDLSKYDEIKNSELEIKKRIADEIDKDYHNAVKLNGAMKQNNEMLEALNENRTKWLSYDIASPYFAHASLLAWQSDYDEDTSTKNVTLEDATKFFGRLKKNEVLECNEDARIQFVNAYADIKAACRNNDKLMEMLKVYQQMVEDIKNDSVKKGGKAWIGN